MPPRFLARLTAPVLIDHMQMTRELSAPPESANSTNYPTSFDPVSALLQIECRLSSGPRIGAVRGYSSKGPRPPPVTEPGVGLTYAGLACSLLAFLVVLGRLGDSPGSAPRVLTPPGPCGWACCPASPRPLAGAVLHLSLHGDPCRTRSAGATAGFAEGGLRRCCRNQREQDRHASSRIVTHRAMALIGHSFRSNKVAAARTRRADNNAAIRMAARHRASG